MKPILHLVLSATALLLTACSPASETPTPPAAKTPPAGAQPKPEAAVAPAPVAAPAPAPAPKSAAVAAPALADLGKVLGSIKDAPTAEAAKGPLDALVLQLQTAKASVPAGTKDALGGISKLASDAAAKAGVSPEVMTQLASLLDNPTIKAVIGPTLEKLQGLLK
jgi:hypothetical protein